MEPYDSRDRLAARTYCYRLFQNLFGAKPTARVLEVAGGDVTEAALAILCPQCPAELVEGFMAAAGHASGAMDSLVSAYNRLFVGPARLPVPPWESVYVAGERLIMQKSTLDVRLAYKAQGYLPACYPHVADDHLALELGFMAELAQRAQDVADNDAQACAAALEASRAFVREHLAAWIPAYAAAIGDEAPGTLYAFAAALLSQVVAADEAVLDALVANN